MNDAIVRICDLYWPMQYSSYQIASESTLPVIIIYDITCINYVVFVITAISFVISISYYALREQQLV